MLSNIIFSLDRVLPYFLLIVLGVLLRKGGLVPKSFFSEANRFTVNVALPCQLFYSIVSIETSAGSAGPFLFYMFIVALVSFAAVWALTEVVFRNGKPIIGTLVQGSFRSNFILIGIPLAGAVMGPAAEQIAALSSIVVMTVYNVFSVVVLSVRGKASKVKRLGDVLRDIFSSYIIISVFFAVPFWLFGIGIPQIAQTTLGYVGATASPLGLLSIGGLLNFRDATARLRPAMYSVAIKNILMPLAVVFVSYRLGFRNEELLVLFIVAGAPVAISSYAMACELGGDPPLASNILILSTLFAGFSLALGIYLLKSLALI